MPGRRTISSIVDVFWREWRLGLEVNALGLCSDTL